jgi:hypothetical protein
MDTEGRNTEELLEQLEEKVKKLCDPAKTSADQAARSVVRALASYMGEGGRLPQALTLSIGGCLLHHLDVAEDSADEDIKRLFELCDQDTAELEAGETVDYSANSPQDE